MRIDGAWRICDDGIVRPVLWGEIQTGDGGWFEVLFLADCGADRTVLSADVLGALGAQSVQPAGHLQGVGGQAASVIVDTQIRMVRQDGAPVVLRGQFAAFTDPAALDMSVLGRDITNLFALIIDRPQDVVCLIGQQHRYVITRN